MEKLEIKCSNCDKDLATIYITDPDQDIEQKIVVHCPFCNDKSFIFKAKGKISFAPANNVIPIDIREEGDVFHYDTETV